MKKIEGRFFISFFSQLSSGDASDSICPKGWGMAGWEGDGSYQKLIANVYGTSKDMMNNTLNIEYKERNIYIRPDELLIHSFLQYIRSGNYNFSDGFLSNRRLNGNYRESSVRINTNNSAYSLNFRSTNLSPQYSNLRNHGFSLRCVAK